MNAITPVPLPLDEVLVGDCLEALARLPDSSVDLVFADPPYNLQLGGQLTRPDGSAVDGVDDDWDRFASFADYDAFTRAWLAQARRVMKPTATIWVTGSYHNVHRIGSAMQDLGFWILNDIVWRKANPTPNFRGTRFTNAHETLIWGARSRDAKGYTFRYEALKAGNEDVQMRSDWFFPICTGAERLKDADGETLHPTQKPEALLARVLLASSKPGDVVLDPFFGTGTTGSVARRLGRHFVGIERHPGYAAAARARIAAVERLDEAALVSPPPKRKRKRAVVDFPFLVSNAIVLPGERLVDRSRRHEAVVQPDATIALGGAVGSIHQIGALAQGTPSCNGWAFWHRIDGGELKPLDATRKRVGGFVEDPWPAITR